MASVALLIPIVYAVFVNALFVFAAAVWLMILPMAWRDVWRRVRVGSQPTIHVPDVAPPDIDEGDAIASRAGVPRW